MEEQDQNQTKLLLDESYTQTTNPCNQSWKNSTPKIQSARPHTKDIKGRSNNDLATILLIFSIS